MSILNYRQAKTNRDIRHRFKLVLKGGIPEPEYPSQTFPILGNSSVNYGKLKEGNINGCRKYWFDSSNLIISPDTGKIDIGELVEDSIIMPAIGPEFSPSYENCKKSDYVSEIHQSAIKAANQYFRNIFINQMRLFQNPDAFFSKGTGKSGQTAITIITNTTTNINTTEGTGVQKGPAEIIEAIQQHGQDEAKLENKDVTLIWAEEIYPPNIKYGQGDYAMMQASKKIEALSQLLYDEGLIPEDSEFLDAFHSQQAEKESIMKQFDVTEITQDVFGHSDITCIDRSSSEPFIPFSIIGPELKVGEPNIIRLFLKQPGEGMDSNRLHIDLSDKIRLTIERGSTIKIMRRRDQEELQEFLDSLDPTEKKKIIQTIDKNALDKKGRIKSKEYVRLLEEKLETLYLSMLVYDGDNLKGEDPYNTIIGKLQEQKHTIDQYRIQMADIRVKYRDKAKASGGSLTQFDKASRDKELDDIREKISDLKKSTGKNEVIRRKIAQLEKIIYANSGVVWNRNSDTIVDTPFQMTIIDYGVGVILFEANDQSEAFVYKDKETIRKALKGAKGAAGTRNIKILDQDSYFPLIGGSKLRLSGNGGTFSFAQDTTKVVGESFVDIPISTDKPIKLTNKKISQEINTILVTNLPYLSKNIEIKTDENNPNKFIYDCDNGTITAELLPGYDGEEIRPADTPGYTQWVRFEQGDIADPYKVKNYDPKNYLFKIRLTFTSKNNKLPMLFRGFMNLIAVPTPWEAIEGTPHIIEVGDNENGKPYTIDIEPTFNEGKRRVVYQVSLSYKDTVPEDILQRVFDYMPGKRCDIIYIHKEEIPSSEPGGTPTINEHELYLMKDGYIGDNETEDMLTITQPPNPVAAKIKGMFHYGPTKITFNVMDSLRVLEDQMMSDRSILEGYHFKNAIYLLLRNGGFPDEKLSTIRDNAIPGKYVNVNTNSQKFLPVALPGQEHSFFANEDSTRFSEISDILEKYGWESSGILNLWVDWTGNVKLNGPINLHLDPRWNNFYFYKSRQQILDEYNESNRDMLDRYYYYSPIVRNRTLDDFFSILKVRGAINPLTGKPSTVGFTKKEVITAGLRSGERDYKNEAIFLGHHKEMAVDDMSTIKTTEELIYRLRYLVNKYVQIKETWTMTAPYNPFLLPYDVIFVAPDNRVNGTRRESLSSGASTETVNEVSSDIAWKVINISTDVKNDEMKLIISPLTREEIDFVKARVGK